MYLNRANKERVASSMVVIPVVDDLLSQEERFKPLFGKGWGWLKSSRSLMVKALAELAVTLGPEESEKIHKVAKNSTFAVISRYAPRNNEATLPVDVDALYDLGELAIQNHCVGCTKSNHKECKVFQVLQKADIPAAQEGSGCPYLQ